MRTCLVLGAGATLANALYFHGERMVAQNPPLDYTFFDKISSLSTSVGPDLRWYATNTPGPDPFRHRAGQPAMRMEEFFRDLFSDFQEAPPSSRVARAYEQLVDLYVRVLRETTDWICQDGKTGGPVGRLIAAAAAGSETVTIITFNHDLVIENEIFKRARLRRRWCVEKSYGTFSDVLNYTGVSGSMDEFPPHSAECEHGSGITLLKLHGSLNWYVRMQGQHPSRRVLSGAAASPTIFCTRRRTVPHQLRYNRRGRGRGRQRWYTWPVVVPPVHGKEALIRSFVPQPWADAELALGQAGRVVLVGYSMPNLDVHAERLFKRAIASNSVLQWVDAVNPAPASAERYASIISPTPLRWYPSIDRFLASEDA